MELHEASADGIPVLEVKGRVDSMSAPILGRKLTDAFASSQKRVIVDLSGAEYMTSAGLRVLLRAAEQVEQSNGKLILHGLNSRLEEVFEVSGFADIFTICKTRHEAVGLAAS